MTYGTLGLEMGVSLAVGLAIGYYLDRHFGTSPVLTLIFMGFGLAAGMRRLYSLWRRWKRTMRETTTSDIERINVIILCLARSPRSSSCVISRISSVLPWQAPS